MRKLLTAAVLLGAVALVVGGCSKPAPPPDPVEVEVKEVKYDELDEAVTARKGKVVLVDFWATWCGPCVKKFPRLVELHNTYKDKGLTAVSVSMDKAGPKGSYDKEKVLKFLKEKDAKFPNFIVIDPDGDEQKITKRFGLEGGIPFMALFAKDGTKVWDSETKKLMDDALVKLIEAELAK